MIPHPAVSVLGRVGDPSDDHREVVREQGGAHEVHESLEVGLVATCDLLAVSGIGLALHPDDAFRHQGVGLAIAVDIVDRHRLTDGRQEVVVLVDAERLLVRIVRVPTAETIGGVAVDRAAAARVLDEGDGGAGRELEKLAGLG